MTLLSDVLILPSSIALSRYFDGSGISHDKSNILPSPRGRGTNATIPTILEESFNACKHLYDPMLIKVPCLYRSLGCLGMTTLGSF